MPDGRRFIVGWTSRVGTGWARRAADPPRPARRVNRTPADGGPKRDSAGGHHAVLPSAGGRSGEEAGVANDPFFLHVDEPIFIMAAS